MSNLGGNSPSEDTDKSNNLQGEKGDTGATGATGAQGGQGATGATGATGSDGVVQSVVAGTNITSIDNTDPANPIINAATQTISSPLTTKGDVFTYDTGDQRLAIGANDTVLTADSAEATGMKWTAPAAASRIISDTTLGSAVQTIGDATLSNLTEVDFELHVPAPAAATGVQLYINADTTDANYRSQRIEGFDATVQSSEADSAFAGSARAITSLFKGSIRMIDSHAQMIVTVSSANTSTQNYVQNVSIHKETTDTDITQILLDVGGGKTLPIGTRLVVLSAY